jgi:hypothetical protein
MMVISGMTSECNSKQYFVAIQHCHSAILPFDFSLPVSPTMIKEWKWTQQFPATTIKEN